MRRKDLFHEVYLPLRKGYVFVEELIREFSHNKLGLFQSLSSFPLRRSFYEEARSLLTDKTRIHLRSASVRTTPFSPWGFPRFL
jgi:hypothetical protein